MSKKTKKKVVVAMEKTNVSKEMSDSPDVPEAPLNIVEKINDINKNSEEAKNNIIENLQSQKEETVIHIKKLKDRIKEINQAINSVSKTGTRINKKELAEFRNKILECLKISDKPLCSSDIYKQISSNIRRPISIILKPYIVNGSIKTQGSKKNMTYQYV